jgi:Gas vesicle synthesis protein GvpO
MAAGTSRSSSTKKASPAKKAAKKSTTKAAAKKSTSTQRGDQTGSDGSSSRGRSAARAESRPAARASRVAAQAASELLELTGKAAEGVTGLERTEDGWTVEVEVVEVRRIPDTTDVLALYEVTTDKQGSLMGYRRVRRYARGSAGDS